MTVRAWLPAVIGLVAGIAAGLYYTWVLDPVEYTETAPISLRADFKADYLTLIASAYAATGDLSRAQARLQLFPDPNSAETLAALAQQRLATGRPESEAQGLALLAAALGERPTPLATVPQTRVASAGPASPGAPTGTVTLTPLPPPTRTPSPTPGAPYRLVEQQKVCDPNLSLPLIQIVVVDAAGADIPGVEVVVVWDAGTDRFFTGLKPELGEGYADFEMTEGFVYTVQLQEGENLITGLTAEDCATEAGELFLGSWLLRFAQPEI